MDELKARQERFTKKIEQIGQSINEECDKAKKEKLDNPKKAELKQGIKTKRSSSR